MLLALLLPSLARAADCSAGTTIVINEIMPNPSGSDSATTEWIELKNTGASDVVLDGWTLEFAKSSWSAPYSIPAGTTISAGGYALFGAGGIAVSTLDLGNGTSGDGVRLGCGGTVIDAVIYGSNNDDELTDESGTKATSLAPSPTEGSSLARVPDGTDTNLSADDFEKVSGGTPGASNGSGGGSDSGGGDSGGGSADCAGADGVVINEFTPLTDVEYVELYNGGTSAVALAGWVLEFGTSSYNKTVELPAATLAPGDWFVFGSAGAAVKDVEIDIDLGNASTGGDAMRLVCGGNAVDTVIYGDDGASNSDGWTDDSGAVATSMAPYPGSGESISRVQDGYDTDVCGADFAVTEPSPGAANPYSEPPVCETDGVGVVTINEFLYNPDSSDTDLEWVELYNSGAEPVRLDGWVIETATSSWGADHEFPAGTELAPGGFLVVGGPAVPFADQISDDLSLGNGTRGDGVRLVDCTGGVVDTVLYGETLTDPLEGDGGSTQVVPEIDEGSTIGRWPDGTDTNAAADWKVYAAPTPGSANPDPGAVSDDTGDTGGGNGGGGDDRPPGGCGGAPEDEGRPDGGGCATVLPLGGGELLLAALAVVRRRRRA